MSRLKEVITRLTKQIRLHLFICKYLASSSLTLLTKELTSIPFGERSCWSSFWMIYPIDGTKGWIEKNGEFTVNIAMIQNSYGYHKDNKSL